MSVSSVKSKWLSGFTLVEVMMFYSSHVDSGYVHHKVLPGFAPLNLLPVLIEEFHGGIFDRLVYSSLFPVPWVQPPRIQSNSNPLRMHDITDRRVFIVRQYFPWFMG